MIGNYFKAALLGLGMAAAGVGGASATTWDTHLVNNGVNGLGNTLSFTAGGITIATTGWTSTPSNGNFAASSINEYSGFGLGVCNATELSGSCGQPDHAVDNNVRNDFVLIVFGGNTVNGISVDITGIGYDSDVTYYSGTGATPTLTALNPSSAGLGSASTNLGSTLASGSPRTITIAGSAKWILIGAALPNNDGNLDYFKVRSITATATTVPEPASWMLMILGFAGLAAARRRLVATA